MSRVGTPSLVLPLAREKSVTEPSTSHFRGCRFSAQRGSLNPYLTALGLTWSEGLCVHGCGWLHCQQATLQFKPAVMFYRNVNSSS